MAEIGLTSKFYADTGASSAYEEYAGLISVTLPAVEYSMQDTTHLGQAGRIKTCIPSLGSPGTLDLEFYYTSALMVDLQAIEGVAQNFRVDFSSGQRFTMPGFVKSNQVEVSSAEDVKKLKTSIQLTAGITLGTVS